MKEKKKRSLGRPRLSEKSKPTNEVILHAAIQLFLSEGFKNVSLDDVAKRCNVTKATIYYYFESKAALFTEAMTHLMTQIREYMLQMLLEPEPLRERLHRVTEAHLRATFDIDLDGFLREAKSSLSEKQLQAMQHAESKMFDALENAFTDAMNNKEIPEINAKFAVHSYMSLLKVGNYRNPDQTRLFPTIEETALKIMDLFWNGLFPYSGETGKPS
ncbi:TetR/AcrR family transcriptional regulator [Cytobacillus sp. FJAT-54145]|uniref:TetR/AcrR family transcriptional regulator n=1 Tax=Cytobacillus spartinae TaxID=3299023 RepID=A0ABW6KBA2_9BACI